jgi:hypothetical protein
MGLGSWIKKAAKKVKDAAKAVVNAVEEAVSDVVEDVGNAIEDALDWLGQDVPVWSHFVKWVGRVVSSVFDLVAAIVKGVIGIVVGVIGGIITMVVGVFVGVFTGDWSVLAQGFRTFLAGIVGGIILILGKAWAVVQSVFHLQSFERKLTDAEKKIVRRVFRESIALYNVRLIEGWSGLFDLSDRPFTLGNTIYLKDRDISAEPGLLIHECVHVWQYQNNGASYIGSALGAQWFIPEEYDWERDIQRGNADWVDFNEESQGQFFEDLWACGSLVVGGVTTNGNGEFFFADGQKKTGSFIFSRSDCDQRTFPTPPTGVDYTNTANDAVDEVRNAETVRPSTWWS